MTEVRSLRVIAAVILTLGCVSFAHSGESLREHTSRNGHFHLTWSSEVEPLSINRMHSWSIRITTANGEPLDKADILISGGMPLHNHGLPSSPRVTEALGNGHYRVGGMRFHMLGDWQLVFNIEAGQQRDVIVVPLKILQ